MPISIAAFDEALALAQGWVQAEFPDENLADDSYHGKWARILAMLYWADQAALQDADSDWPPSDSSSTAALDAAAELLGLPNGAGGFGRLVATAASGGLGTITGTNGTAYAANLQLAGPDGVTLFKLTSLETIPGVPPGTSMVANAPFVALTTGKAGNLLAGAQLQWSSPPAGNVGPVVLTQGLLGGTDSESNSDLLARIRARLQNPPKGGASPDWRGWARSVVPVNEGYVYPLHDGTGTVLVVCTQAGSGTSRQPAGSVITAALAAFDAARLVCVEGRRAQAPYMPGGAACSVVIRVVPTTGNGFDWDSSAGTWTVDLVTVGPPYTIRLSTLAPADLKAAISAGSKPRIQIRTSGVVLPVELRCTAFADGGGKTTLTIDVAPTVNPTVGDSVFASGNPVGPVAASVLALVDGLGPSRMSGFADPKQAWDDTLRVDALIRVAMDAVDGSGASLVLDLVAPPTINGAATNKQAVDVDVNGPQLLYLASLAVTP